MDYQKATTLMESGDIVEGFYILKTVSAKVASNGRPFLSAVVLDRHGEIDAKAWDYAGPINDANVGEVIWLQGSVTTYKGVLQLKIERLRLADESDSFDISELVPTAPIDPAVMLEDVRALINSIADPDYRSVAQSLLDRHEVSFRSIPAAKSVHHSFLNGLLMHTGNMMKLADFLAGLYGDTVDRSLLLAGTFAHDLQKESEFTFSQLGLVTDYSDQGYLLGHLVMGAQDVAEVCHELNVPAEKAVLLQHMVLSHHGEPEYGAAVKPMCAESELLSYIDLIDSRMEIYQEALQNLQPGEWSDRIFALDKRIYRHP